MLHLAVFFSYSYLSTASQFLLQSLVINQSWSQVSREELTTSSKYSDFHNVKTKKQNSCVTSFPTRTTMLSSKSQNIFKHPSFYYNLLFFGFREGNAPSYQTLNHTQKYLLPIGCSSQNHDCSPVQRIMEFYILLFFQLSLTSLFHLAILLFSSTLTYS